jgi:Carboxypeptidase regulatory-like domain
MRMALSAGVLAAVIFAIAIDARQSSAGGTVSGWTLGPNRAPLAGVEVALPCPPQPVRRVTTGSDGRFEFTGLPDGACRVIARKDGYVEAFFNGDRRDTSYGIAVAAGSTHAGIELELERGAIIAGVARDAKGKPLAGFVHVVRRESVNGVVSLRPQSGYMRVRPDGTFQMTPLPPGEYYVGLRPPPGTADRAFTFHPGTPDISAATTLELKAGDRREVTLSLAEAATYRASGIVVDSEGAPLADVDVSVVSEGSLAWIRATARTAKDGRFSIDGLEEGPYRIGAVRTLPQKRVQSGELHVTIAGNDLPNLTLQTAVR